MNAALQAQLTRLEGALSTLTESISAYNPSSTAAQELVQADDALSTGLDQRARSHHLPG